MKKFITAFVLCIASVGYAAETKAPIDKAPAPAAAASGPNYKEVCRETKDKGKVCKKIRVHKKLEGKPVPDKK